MPAPQDDPALSDGIPPGYKLVPLLKETDGDVTTGSLPLFLPNYLEYDAKTNTVSPGTTSSPKNSASNNPSALYLVPNAGWDRILSQLDAPNGLSVLSCIGPYRTGKSLLVSRFFGNKSSRSFEIGSTLEGRSMRTPAVTRPRAARMSGSAATSSTTH